MYRSGSTARELARYNLDLMVVKVRWDKGGMVRAAEYILFYAKGNKSSIGNRIFCTPQISIRS